MGATGGGAAVAQVAPVAPALVHDGPGDLQEDVLAGPARPDHPRLVVAEPRALEQDLAPRAGGDAVQLAGGIGADEGEAPGEVEAVVVLGVNSIESQQAFQQGFYSSVGHPVVLKILLKSLLIFN